MRYYAGISNNGSAAVFDEEGKFIKVTDMAGFYKLISGKKVLHTYVSESIDIEIKQPCTSIDEKRWLDRFGLKETQQAIEKVIHLIPKLKNTINQSKAEAVLIAMYGIVQLNQVRITK